MKMMLEMEEIAHQLIKKPTILQRLEVQLKSLLLKKFAQCHLTK